VPVHTSATVGKGTGSHGRTVRTAGSAVRGHLRHARTRHAASVAAGQIQAGPGTATRTAAASADATVSVPAAHQTARPTINGPARVRRRVKKDGNTLRPDPGESGAPDSLQRGHSMLRVERSEATNPSRGLHSCNAGLRTACR